MLYLHLIVPERARAAVAVALHEIGAAGEAESGVTERESIQVDPPSPDVARAAFELFRAGLVHSVVWASRQPDGAAWQIAKRHPCLIVSEDLAAAASDFGGLKFEHVRSVSGTWMVHRVEAIRSSRQWVARSAVEVREDPSRFYGKFADPAYGGWHALYATGWEAASADGHGAESVLVGSIEELGYAEDDADDSVQSWRRRGVIAAHAYGFRLQTPDGVAGFMADHKIAESGVIEIFERDRRVWIDQGLSFGVALVLVGLDDPFVVVPMGAVFQQPQAGLQRQNLAVAHACQTHVAAGARVGHILPAWCLNPTFDPPNGPLAPTALRSTLAHGTQADAWRAIRHHGGLP